MKWMLLPVSFGLGTVLFLQTSAPADAPVELAQYGVLGVVATGEAAALVWLGRRFITYLEEAAKHTTEALVAATEVIKTTGESTHGLTDVVMALQKAMELHTRAIERMEDREFRK